MIICSCNRVSDNDIREAVERGATSLKALRRHTNLGSNCGGCLKSANSIVQNHIKDMCESQPDLYYAV